MDQHRTRCSRDQAGQALILFTLMLVAFLGFCALVVDVGRAYAERRYMQNAADAGAIVAGRLAAASMAPCSSGANCTGGVASKATEGWVIEQVRAQVVANRSLLGGYTTSDQRPTVQVQYARWNNSTNGCNTSSYITMTSTGGNLPGDTCKLRVIATAKWASWFPIPSGGVADPLSRQPAQASAEATAMIVGGETGEAQLAAWPMVRRRSRVCPTCQSLDPTALQPFLFWDSDVVHSVDGAGANWDGIVNLGLYSVRRDQNGNGYSRLGNPAISTLEGAWLRTHGLNDSYDGKFQWFERNDLTDASCTGTFNCGRNWYTNGNAPVGSLESAALSDFPRDPQNLFYYTSQAKVSLTSNWSTRNCNSGPPNNGPCQIPYGTAITSPTYEVVKTTADGLPPWWKDTGDWVETYNGSGLGGGNVGNNIMDEIKEYIRLNGSQCLLSSVVYTKNNRSVVLGRCVTIAVYLWEGGQDYDPQTNTWVPWASAGSHAPDRVHLTDFWYFTFYEGLTGTLSSSEIDGFFGAYTEDRLPGPIKKPNGKFNYTGLVSE